MTTDDGSLTLWDSNLEETYHSGCGAVAESLLVYLANSRVLELLISHRNTSVFELGFGTGSSFFLTAALAEQFQTVLDYWAIEIRPLPRSLVANTRLCSHLEEAITQNQSRLSTQEGNLTVDDFRWLKPIQNQLAEQWPEQFQANSKIEIQIGNYSRLHLIVGDATHFKCHNFQPSLESKFDAIYFDAFSPESAPHLWTESVLTEMARALKSNATLTSYCVKSSIRRVLEQIGFKVQRLVGPTGGKREVLRAIK